MQRLRRLATALRDEAAREHPLDPPRIIETHISLILLAGSAAYKFKKPVDLGFVDFSTLARREFYCREELRLNRRLLPEWYLGVVSVGGTPQAPRLGVEPAIEYALHMRRFPPGAELDEALQTQRVPPQAFAEFAVSVAAFHDRAAAADPGGRLGSAALLQRYGDENFEVLEREAPAGDSTACELPALRRWSESELQRLRALIDERCRTGRVRECHGDMHLTNMLWLDGRIRLFDCIEFNEELRWIDVMNEIAFLIMDLDDRGRGDLARIFLNTYLEAGGDYEGLALLPQFYVYRSLVRAKVAALLAQQASQEAARQAARERRSGHVALATRYIRQRPRPTLIITHGLAGSGKSSLVRALIPIAERTIHLRSDVERKRLHGLAALESSGSEPGRGLYTAAATDQTYARLETLARTVLEAGFAVIVDATFLSRARRKRFAVLATELECRFRILSCEAPHEELRRRIAARSRAGDDASEADLEVLERQLRRAEPFDDDERAAVLRVDTLAGIGPEEIARRLEIRAT